MARRSYQKKKDLTDNKDTRTLLLRTAEKVFAEKGYNGARVAEIAARAGIDKRLIFYYFKSKEGLYSQILEDFFENVQPLLIDFVAKDVRAGKKERVKKFLENMTDVIYKYKDPIRILFREFLDSGILLESLTQKYIITIFDLWKDYYPRLFPPVTTKSRESDHMLITLSGISLFYFLVAPLLEKIWAEDPLSPENIEQRKRIIQRLLRDMD